MAASNRDFPYCLTTTIDNSDIGRKYYHNIMNENNIVMRPRIPLRYDFNDVGIVKISREKARELTGQTTNINNIFWLRRSGYNVANTFLLHTLAIILIITSIINMRKVLTIIQEDDTLGSKKKVLFQAVFILSFVVILVVLCFLSISMFELSHNFKRFANIVKNNIWYKNLVFQDGMFSVRWIILLFVLVCIIVACAETFNLFFMEPNQPSILILFIPIVMCIILMINMYALYFNN